VVTNDTLSAAVSALTYWIFPPCSGKKIPDLKTKTVLGSCIAQFSFGKLFQAAALLWKGHFPLSSFGR